VFIVLFYPFRPRLANATHARVHNARHAFRDVLFREVITYAMRGAARFIKAFLLKRDFAADAIVYCDNI
jgi:hypothetical protein